MRKFFVESENISDGKVRIKNSDVNHIKNVLRLGISDKVQICDKNTSSNYICEITEISQNEVELHIIERIESEIEGNVELDIFQGLPKADKMELIIQKGTELGVNRFIPVKFERCVVKLDEKSENKKLDRWQKIAEVAAKQSMRDLVPKIEKIVTIKNITEIIKEYDLVLLAYELEKNNYIKNELKKIKNEKNGLGANKIKYRIAVIIGPEGGIEEKEVEVLRNAGAMVVSLGKRILRTETVAMQVSSIIMYELENGGN